MHLEKRSSGIIKDWSVDGIHSAQDSAHLWKSVKIHLAVGLKISGRDQRKVLGNIGYCRVRLDGLYEVAENLYGKLVYQMVVPKDFQEVAVGLAHSSQCLVLEGYWPLCCD